MSALASPDTEKSILGAILLNGDAYFEAAPLLRLEDFSLDSHRKIYGRMVALAGAGKPIDSRTLVEELQNAKELKAVGDVAYIASLLDGVPDRPSIVHLVRIVTDKARRRKALAAAQALEERVQDSTVSTEECLSGIQEALLAIEADQGEKQARKLVPIMKDLVQELDRQVSCSGLVGLTTGLPTLDDMTGGIRKGELCTPVVRLMLPPSQFSLLLVLRVVLCCCPKV